MKQTEQTVNTLPHVGELVEQEIIKQGSNITLALRRGIFYLLHHINPAVEDIAEDKKPADDDRTGCGRGKMHDIHGKRHHDNIENGKDPTGPEIMEKFLVPKKADKAVILHA